MFEEDYPFEIGKANVLREGTDAAVFACGLMVSETLAAARLLEAQGIHIAVINVHTIKPIDAACVTQWAEKCGNVVTVEEHSVIGGLGDAVADVLMGKVSCKFRKIGVNDQLRPVRQGRRMFCGSMDSPPTRSPTASGDSAPHSMQNQNRQFLPIFFLI